MRHITTNATHLAATLAVTAAAVLAAFAIPVPAHALALVVEGNGGGNFVHGSGKEVDVARKVGAFSALRLDSSVDVHAHAGARPASPCMPTTTSSRWWRPSSRATPWWCA